MKTLLLILFLSLSIFAQETTKDIEVRLVSYAEDSEKKVYSIDANNIVRQDDIVSFSSTNGINETNIQNGVTIQWYVASCKTNYFYIAWAAAINFKESDINKKIFYSLNKRPVFKLAAKDSIPLLAIQYACKNS